MASLIPENVEKELREIVGDNYCELKELDRIILVLAHQFGDICNTDIQFYSPEHPRDIGECLKYLVNNSWLERTGRGRGTYYSLVNKGQPDLLSLLPSSEHNEPNSEHNTTPSLLEIAAPVRDKKRVSPELMQSTILQLCSGQYLLLKTLSELLERSPDTIRTHYINLMLEQGLLELKYPAQPNHPQQAYKTASLPNAEIKKASDTPPLL